MTMLFPPGQIAHWPLARLRPYALAVATPIVVLPLFGLHPSLGENLALGGVFTVISLVRGYTLRRLFERLRAR